MRSLFLQIKGNTIIYKNVEITQYEEDTCSCGCGMTDTTFDFSGEMSFSMTGQYTLEDALDRLDEEFVNRKRLQEQ